MRINFSNATFYTLMVFFLYFAVSHNLSSFSNSERLVSPKGKPIVMELCAKIVTMLGLLSKVENYNL